MPSNSKPQPNKEKPVKWTGNPIFFVMESLLFLLTQFLGLAVGFRLHGIEEVRKAIEAQPISLSRFLITFFIGTAILLLLLRFVKKKAIFQGLFYFLLFFGCLVFFDAFLPFFLTVLASVVVVALRFCLPSVLTQNLAIIFSIAGISAYLGLSLTVIQVIILLLVLSIYDVIAVYKTKHMVEMFKTLAQSGAVFSLVVPDKIRDFSVGVKDVKPGSHFLFLGTGDLAFPIIFSISALKVGLISSVFIILGAFFGLGLINLYFHISKRKMPVAALPPIALGAIVGYLISLIFL
jgi:presenilin-like A22 family membrane protease